MKLKYFAPFLLVLVQTLPIIAAVPTLHQSMLRTVALSNESLPGFTSAALGFGIPQINRQGEVAFVGDFEASDWGLWSEAAGNGLQLLARRSSEAPGDPAPGVFGQIRSFQMADDETFFHSSIINPTPPIDVLRSGFWAASNGQVQPILIQGQLRPGGEGGERISLSLINSPIVTGNGDFYIEAFTGSQSDVWHWSSLSGLEISLPELAIGSPAVGLTPKAANSLGQVVISANAAEQEIWLHDPVQGNRRILADAIAPFVEASELSLNLANSSVGAIDSLQRVTLLAGIDGLPLGTTGTAVLRFSPDGSIETLATSTAVTAILNPPANVGGLTTLPLPFEPRRLLANDAGDLVIKEGETGFFDSSEGYWDATSGEELRPIVMEGDFAPGFDGVRFLELGFLNPAFLSESGQLLFQGRLDNNVFGLWIESAPGVLESIVKSGDLLEVSPGDFRVLADLFAGSLNEGGQLAFRASFTDGTSGVFVTTVPELGTLALSSLGMLIGFGWVARKKPIRRGTTQKCEETPILPIPYS